MKDNPRVIAELAEFLNCAPEDVISYTLDPKLMDHQCCTCQFFTGEACDIGDGKPLQITEDTHSCKLYKEGLSKAKKGKKIPRCGKCAYAMPSPFGGRYCSCRLHGLGVSFPKLAKACEFFKVRKETHE